MAKSKKRRKVLVFSVIAVVLLGLTAVVIFKKRDVVITVQTEKVARRNLTEIVMANGKIQPVLQVKISAEVSGEIIDLPVKEGQSGQEGRFAGEDQAGRFTSPPSTRPMRATSPRWPARRMAEATLRKAEAELYTQPGPVPSTSSFPIPPSIEVQAAYDVAKAQLESAVHQVDIAKAAVDSATGLAGQDDDRLAADRRPSASSTSHLGERVLGTTHDRRHRNHDHRRPQ